MGTKDIKQSLKIKQKQDRDLQLPEDTEPTAILALGLREMRIGDVKIAMNCINKVLDSFLFLIEYFYFFDTVVYNSDTIVLQFRYNCLSTCNCI